MITTLMPSQCSMIFVFVLVMMILSVSRLSGERESESARTRAQRQGGRRVAKRKRGAREQLFNREANSLLGKSRTFLRQYYNNLGHNFHILGTLCIIIR